MKNPKVLNKTYQCQVISSVDSIQLETLARIEASSVEQAKVMFEALFGKENVLTDPVEG